MVLGNADYMDRTLEHTMRDMCLQTVKQPKQVNYLELAPNILFHPVGHPEEIFQTIEQRNGIWRALNEKGEEKYYGMDKCELYQTDKVVIIDDKSSKSIIPQAKIEIMPVSVYMRADKELKDLVAGALVKSITEPPEWKGNGVYIGFNLVYGLDKNKQIIRVETQRAIYTGEQYSKIENLKKDIGKRNNRSVSNQIKELNK